MHQLDRRIFLMIFYPLITTKGIVFKSFLVDLRQIPHNILVLLGLLAVLTTFLQILQRIIHPAICQTNLLSLCRLKCRLKLILVTKCFRHIGQILQRIIHQSIFHLFVFVGLLMSIPEKDNIFSPCKALKLVLIPMKKMVL